MKIALVFWCQGGSLSSCNMLDRFLPVLINLPGPYIAIAEGGGQGGGWGHLLFSNIVFDFAEVY